MQIKIDTTPYANLETDAIVSYVFDETDPVQGTLADIDKSRNSSPPRRKRLLAIVPAVAATCAAAAYAVATLTAPFVIPFTTSANVNATAALVARVAIGAAILTAMVLGVPLLPIYTPVRARYYRAAKWLTVIILSVLLYDPVHFREWSWLMLNCFSFVAWIELKRMSIRRKVPAADWPKHLYL